MNCKLLAVNLLLFLLSFGALAQSDAPTVEAMEERLLATPVLHNLDTEQVQEIFALGQQLGNRADVFTTIGDSNTTNGDFLQPIGLDGGSFCRWGEYEHLLDTVEHFSVSPDGLAANSFTRQSLAAKMGFNTAAVLDPFWATSSLCARGESPLACELRVSRPGFVVIMLGGRDILALTADEYRQNMTQIVEETVAAGVIPILTTFVVLEERTDVYAKSLEFNMALLDIAEVLQIPLINLWRAANDLPDHGIGPDRSHLRARVGDFCAFDGAETQLGGTLRNLLTLQALDALRLSLVEPAANS